MKKLKLTNDKGTQIVLSLLKAHGIKRVIASPGTTNIALVASMQIDPWFEMYSAVDERGAAYMAVGMAAASGEPVVITCTEATASRNYYSAMTEAYYRKLPILAITGTHGRTKVGHLEPQVIDRSVIAKDACKLSIEIGKIRDDDDEHNAVLDVNKVLLELTHRGGGPVHINLRGAIDAGFTTENLPKFRKISRISYINITEAPSITNFKRIAIFIGSHRRLSTEETFYIDSFCENHNAVVLCDITSGYTGRFKITPQLLFAQHVTDNEIPKFDLVVHMGEISADYYTQRFLKPDNVWRLSEDGELRDLFGTLTYIFELGELDFFKYYIDKTSTKSSNELYKLLKNKCDDIFSKLPDLPFSNIWIAQNLYSKLDSNIIVHTSILNSNRACNLANNANIPYDIRCNVGGFGIDGSISTIIGSALVSKNISHILVIGDLAFFYDLNALGNHHLPSNIKILLVNNSIGTEFKNYDHPGSMWGDDANKFIAAAGHFGNKSKDLVKNYAENLGFKYLSASTKEEFLTNLDSFMSSPNMPILYEIFTSDAEESEALQKLRTIAAPKVKSITERITGKIKNILSK